MSKEICKLMGNHIATASEIHIHYICQELVVSNLLMFCCDLWIQGPLSTRGLWRIRVWILVRRKQPHRCLSLVVLRSGCNPKCPLQKAPSLRRVLWHSPGGRLAERASEQKGNKLFSDFGQICVLNNTVKTGESWIKENESLHFHWLQHWGGSSMVISCMYVFGWWLSHSSTNIDSCLATQHDMILLDLMHCDFPFAYSDACEYELEDSSLKWMPSWMDPCESCKRTTNICMLMSIHLLWMGWFRLKFWIKSSVLDHVWSIIDNWRIPCWSMTYMKCQC